MSRFPEEFLEEMKPVALARIKGGLFRRAFGGRPMLLVTQRQTVYIGGNRDAGLKYSRAAYFSAVYEAAERMDPRERSAWREDGTLPGGFWDWVEREAASWNSLE